MLYEYECKCGEITDAVRSVDDRHNSPQCSVCGRFMKLVISSPVLKDVVFNEHYDVQLGTYFTSKEGKKKYLKEKGMEQAGGSFSPNRGEKMRPICDYNRATQINERGVGGLDSRKFISLPTGGKNGRTARTA